MKVKNLLLFFVIILLVSCSNENLKGGYAFNKKSEKDDIEIIVKEITVSGNSLYASDYIYAKFTMKNNSVETINIINKDIRLINEKGENFEFSPGVVDNVENSSINFIEPDKSYTSSIYYDININHFEFNKLTFEFPITKGETKVGIPIEISKDEFTKKR